MLNNLLSKTKVFSSIIRSCDSEKVVFDEILEELKNQTNSNIILIDLNGKILTEKNEAEYLEFAAKTVNDEKYVDFLFNEQIRNINEAKAGLILDSFSIRNVEQEKLNNQFAMIAPINAMSDRCGTIVVYRKDNDYSLDEALTFEYVIGVLSIIMLHIKKEVDEEDGRKIAIVKSAMSTLSYSELEAVIHIFGELDGSEGLLVASKIADKAGITRSVIVNALRKFESAGVIESRSLGMKGTFIKVLNEYLLVEINKLRK